MSGDTLNKLCDVAKLKVDFWKKSKGKFIVASLLAGFYVGIGILLIMTIGGLLSSVGSAYTKIVMGVSFGIALSLVIFAGSELFTGNNLIMMVGVLNKKVTWSDTIGIWIYSYIGNFMGSFLIALMFVYADLTKGTTRKFILSVTAAKMNGAFIPLLMRGILCNILVCLAILCAIRMQSESGKLIMIFWCLFAFITTGFEHSIANMTILSIGLLIPHPDTISLLGLANNLIPVTIGNVIGGALLLGGSYYYIGKP